MTRLPEAEKLSSLERGATLFAKGDRCRYVFVLRKGSVKLTLPCENGRECVFHLVRPGEVLDEDALFGPTFHRYSAHILEPAEVFRIPVDAASRRLKRKPDLWRSAAPLLCERLRSLEERLLWQTFLGVKQRLARLILRLSRDGAARELQVSQKDLAGMAGATRETASSALAGLQRDGCIRTLRRRILIVSEDKLLQHSGSLPDEYRSVAARAGRA